MKNVEKAAKVRITKTVFLAKQNRKTHHVILRKSAEQLT